MNPFNDAAILTEGDVRRACEIAVSRQIENLRARRPDARGVKLSPWEGLLLHLQGAVGEVAFAVLHGLTATKGTLGSFADVGAVEVKAITDPTHCLIVRPETPPETVCALMLVAHCPRVPMLGWIVARDAMRDEWRRDPNGRKAVAFFVPAKALRLGLVPRKLLVREPEEVW